MRDQYFRNHIFSTAFIMLPLCFLFPFKQARSQNPELRVDFNFNGRNEAEVNEPGYIAWPVSEGKEDSRTLKGVNVKLKGDFASGWYKAGIQAPFYARWVNDGIITDKPLEVILSGLPEGQHSLLTLHNNFGNPDNAPFAPFDVFVDGKMVLDNLVPSNRVDNTINAETGYLTFHAKTGKEVVLRFEVDPGSTASDKQLVLNGFELNRPDIKKQARMPEPFNGDEHVEEKEALILKWEAAKETVSHELFFGTSREAVASADTSSPEYKGNQKQTFYQVNDLYSMNTYFWRVDEVGASGKVTKGDVWYFRPAQLAFPGAEGYGRLARGGRGGKVVEVTNLNDSGPGSLREAVTRDIGPRTVVFSVSGRIELESRLVLNQPYVTVAGQTAPGKGITVSGAPFGLTGNDGVVRFLRVRVGAGKTYDGMGLTGANHSIIDHCSISWTIDEAFSSRSAHHITLQRTLISEALNIADHGKYEKGKMHGYGATIGGDIGSFHHNLLAHCYGRNWSLGGGLDGNGSYIGRLDIRNNVVYNWGKRTTDGGAHEVNFVNNYYKPGEATLFFHALKAQHESYGGGTQQYYFKGNVMPGHFDEQSQEKGRIIEGDVNYETFVNSPFFASHVTTQSAHEAYKQVLSDVGSNQPIMDDHDKRIIQETLSGSHQYQGSISGLPGIPDTQEDVGGWEPYPEVHREDGWDSDHDGLPDWWEVLHELDPDSEKGDFSDSNADKDRDGFTNLDRYLDWMGKPHLTVGLGEETNIDLSQLFLGYSEQPVYALTSGDNGTVKFSEDGKTARFVSKHPGLDKLVFTVTDGSGSNMSRTIGVHVRK